MCGVFGYVGNNIALDIIYRGLRKLEYRGYDSSGIVVDGNRRLSVLRDLYEENPSLSGYKSFEKVTCKLIPGTHNRILNTDFEKIIHRKKIYFVLHYISHIILYALPFFLKNMKQQQHPFLSKIII